MMRLTIVGFGNQAQAWSLNLRDSGFPLRVALMPHSASFKKASDLGLETVEVGSPQFFDDSAYVLLIPDQAHHHFMLTHANQFNPDSIILYNHGFSLQKHSFHLVFPHLRHVLFAVKSIGSEIRNQYLLKGKMGGVFSLEHVKRNEAQVENLIKKLASALGLNMGVYPTSFAHETQADLFSEQGLLCSLIPYTAEILFRQMVASGIEPELAYFECWHELKLVVNAMVDRGPADFYDLISPNALVGSEKGRRKLMTPELEASLKNLLADIQNNHFDLEIDNANIEGLRKVIQSRWNNSPLAHTFKKLNQEKKI